MGNIYGVRVELGFQRCSPTEFYDITALAGGIILFENKREENVKENMEQNDTENMEQNDTKNKTAYDILYDRLHQSDDEMQVNDDYEDNDESDNNEDDNLETLCRSCHAKEHLIKDKFGKFIGSK